MDSSAKNFVHYLFQLKVFRIYLHLYVFFVLAPVLRLLDLLLTPVFQYFLRGKFMYIPEPGKKPIVTNSKQFLPNHLRFVCISDIHGKFDKISLPHGDVLIISGDLTSRLSLEQPMQQIKKLNDWLGTLPHRYKVIVAGNHDHVLEEMKPEEIKSLFSNALYLHDDYINIHGLTVYGSPCSPLGLTINTAFQLPRKSPELRRLWSKIPSNVDVLVTHAPPKGFLDRNKGCEELLDVVMDRKPKYHIFGHVHDSHGVLTFFHPGLRSTSFINSATLNKLYLPVNYPVVFDHSLH